MEPYQSAASLIAARQAGRLSSQTLSEIYLERIDQREGEIEAFVNFDREYFRQSIEAAKDGPLACLPIGIKDIFDTADLRTEYLSPIYQGYRPRADASIVATLANQGGAPAVKTSTTEFAFFTPATTRNPHNLDYSPGGSSSGSAAAVAAGFLPFAVGTQTGGSIIRPAAFCGVAGYKPTFGLVPTIGMKTFSWSLDTVGFFAGNAEDNGILATAATGRDLLVDAIKHPPRIGLYRGFLWERADKQMQQAVEALAAKAESAGAVVIDIDFDERLTKAHAAHQTIQDFEACHAYAFELKNHRNLLSRRLLETLDNGLAIGPKSYDHAKSLTAEARSHAMKTMADVDVIMTPSAPGPAPFSQKSTGDSVFNRMWTLIGAPCANIAATTTDQSLPLGVQLIAPIGKDKALISISHWIENLV